MNNNALGSKPDPVSVKTFAGAADSVLKLATVGTAPTLLKVAVTLTEPATVTTHVPVALQPSPLQPTNAEPEEAFAVSVTAVPMLNEAEQVVLQARAPGTEVTVPEPAPSKITSSVAVAVWMANGFASLASGLSAVSPAPRTQTPIW